MAIHPFTLYTWKMKLTRASAFFVFIFFSFLYYIVPLFSIKLMEKNYERIENVNVELADHPTLKD